MRTLGSLLRIVLLLVFVTPARAEENEAEAPTPRESAKAALESWLQENPKPIRALPKRWLFMQAQPTAYGFPSPLAIDRTGFDSFGWLEAADPDAVRLYFQLNPRLKDEAASEEVMNQRLVTFMSMTYSDGLVLRTAGSDEEGGAPGAWVLYTRNSKGLVELGRVESGPESMRQDALVKWLTQQLGYDAVAVGANENFLFLAKLRPVKIGAQGLLMKSTSSSIVLKDSKDVGALVRVVYQDGDYLVAKFLLTKGNKPKAPLGSRALFSD